MRVLRSVITSLALIALAGPCGAIGAKELGHHWYVPAYRTEMQTQIAIMTAVSLAVVAGLWLVKTVRTRRSRG